VFGLLLDSLILKVFSSLNNSMILMQCTKHLPHVSRLIDGEGQCAWPAAGEDFMCGWSRTDFAGQNSGTPSHEEVSSPF